jgi:hypothetical protein
MCPCVRAVDVEIKERASHILEHPDGTRIEIGKIWELVEKKSG